MKLNLTLLALVITLGAGCDRLDAGQMAPETTPAEGTPTDARPTPPTTPAPAEPIVLPPPTSGRTTDAGLAINNLEAQLRGTLDAYNSDLGALAFGKRLVDLRLARAQFLGMTSEYAAIDAVAAEVVARSPDEPEAYLLRAGVRAAQHLFSGAIEDLEHALTLGADVTQVNARIASARMAMGTAGREAVLSAAQTVATAYPSYAASVDAATALMALGRYLEADAAFVEAAALYRDVSPIPLAFIDFQRGLMWAESANRPDLARPLYEAAVARLPQYAVANVHLAEIYYDEGQHERALALLERTAAVAEDPEPKAVLGELLLALGQDEARARSLILAAREGYSGLLAQFPAAFADHGAEFFAGPGHDLPRALALAESNLALRQTPRAYGLAIEVALASGNIKRTCALADKARSGWSSPNLEAILERTVEACASL